MSSCTGYYNPDGGWMLILGNLRLQEMMGIMAGERGGRVYATDER